MANASNLQLLAARSPLSCWILWSFLPPSFTLDGTTSGGPLLWLGWDACCWGGWWREPALGLFLSTVKEHLLSVVTTFIIIIPPSIVAAAGLRAVPPTLYTLVRVTCSELQCQSSGYFCSPELFCPISRFDGSQCCSSDSPDGKMDSLNAISFPYPNQI